MNFTYYKITNYNDFVDLDIPSKEFTVELESIGLKTILITKGINVGMLYEGVFLTLNLNDKNPFIFEEQETFGDENTDRWHQAIWIDSENDIWLGIEVDE